MQPEKLDLDLIVEQSKRERARFLACKTKKIVNKTIDKIVRVNY